MISMNGVQESERNDNLKVHIAVISVHLNATLISCHPVKQIWMFDSLSIYFWNKHLLIHVCSQLYIKVEFHPDVMYVIHADTSWERWPPSIILQLSALHSPSHVLIILWWCYIPRLYLTPGRHFVSKSGALMENFWPLKRVGCLFFFFYCCHLWYQ